MSGFLTEYLETTVRLGKSWLEPPLVFCALGDPAHCRQIALAIMAADAGRRNEGRVTGSITQESLQNCPLVGYSLRKCVEAVAFDRTLIDDECAPLKKWLASNVWAMPHANAFSESTFNLMDRVAWVGGPAMSAGTTERRVMHLQNHVLSQRSHSPSNRPGKRKKWHPTRKHLRDGVKRLAQVATTYPIQLDQAVSALPTIDRVPPNLRAHAEKNAAKAAPERRKKYNVMEEAAALTVPLKGKVHSADLGGR